jgi:outer membrane beta-barrel protein
MLVRSFAALALLCALPLGESWAQKPSETPIPNCLDQSITDELGQSLRPRGVQARDFLKQGQLQFTGRGGLLAADLLSSSYMAGGAVGFYLTEDLGIEASFDISPLALDLDKPLAEFFGDDRFEPSMGYLALTGLLWSPIHAKLKMGESIVHADIVLNAGGGKLFHDSVQGLAGQVGAALEIYATQWVTFRFDIRDLLLVQEAVAETRITNNIMATFGVAVWIPTGL